MRLTPPTPSLFTMGEQMEEKPALIEDAVAKVQVYHMGAVGIFSHKLLMQFYFLDYG